MSRDDYRDTECAYCLKWTHRLTPNGRGFIFCGWGCEIRFINKGFRNKYDGGFRFFSKAQYSSNQSELDKYIAEHPELTRLF